MECKKERMNTVEIGERRNKRVKVIKKRGWMDGWMDVRMKCAQCHTFDYICITLY
jgi:hypothetical protein